MTSRVLAVPANRLDQRIVTYHSKPEVDALLAASDRSTWNGDATTRCCCSPSGAA